MRRSEVLNVRQRRAGARCAILVATTFAPLIGFPAFAQSQTSQPLLRPASPEMVTQEGLRRQEERARGLQLQVQPDASTLSAPPASAGPQPLPPETPCFTLREFVLEGAASERFGWLLDSLAPFVNGCAGVGGLQHIAAALDTRLLETGYATTRVSLAPQNLADGKLRIHLHPGRVASISMRDAADPAGARAPTSAASRRCRAVRYCLMPDVI